MAVLLLSGENFKERLNIITKARLADHHFGVSASSGKACKTKNIHRLKRP
ncbi:hypothetical protein [Mariniphaga sp.]